ncbi:3-oxoacyl-ACP synthase III family protein [Streptomyces sp. NPDC056480]|uniref:3-oxoacyl-ACP synthase III family protein n=1 Tax=Streptomyces sp. NPDC056480 TaxID=3345833 RepID=UPI0036B6816A
MGTHAARKAILDAGIGPEQIDVIIYWSFVADSEAPNDGTRIAMELGASNAACIAVEMGLSATSLAMIGVAASLIESGTFNTALIVAVANWSQRAFEKGVDTGPVGDGAGAIVISGRPGRSLLGMKHAREPRYYDAINIRHSLSSGQLEYFNANGVPGFENFANEAPIGFLRDFLNEQEASAGEISWFIPYQASDRICRHWGNSLGFEQDQILTTFHEHGTLSAASVSVVLDHYRNREPRIREGDTVLLCATGAGFNMMAILWRM